MVIVLTVRASRSTLQMETGVRPHSPWQQVQKYWWMITTSTNINENKPLARVVRALPSYQSWEPKSSEGTYRLHGARIRLERRDSIRTNGILPVWAGHVCNEDKLLIIHKTLYWVQKLGECMRVTSGYTPCVLRKLVMSWIVIPDHHIDIDCALFFIQQLTEKAGLPCP